MSHRIPIAASLAVAAALALPSVASAELRSFKLIAEGSGTYSRYDDSRLPDPPIGAVQNVDVSFNWRVVVPRVSFDGTQVLGGYVPESGAQRGSGTAKMVIYGMTGHPPRIVENPGQCVTGERESSSLVVARVQDDPSVVPDVGGPGARVAFTPFTGIEFAASCSGTMQGGESVSVADPNLPDLFTHRFFLPKEAIESGKIIQQVRQTAAQKASCPGASTFTKSCDLTWTGKLTFELIDSPAGPPPTLEEVFVPIPDPPGPPTEDLVVPIPPKLSPNGGQATVKVRCRTACKGAVRAFAAGRSRASRKPRPIAVRRFSAKAGQVKTVTLRFRGRARRAVKRAGAVRLVVTAGGSSETLVARVPRRRHVAGPSS